MTTTHDPARTAQRIMPGDATSLCTGGVVAIPFVHGFDGEAPSDIAACVDNHAIGGTGTCSRASRPTAGLVGQCGARHAPYIQPPTSYLQIVCRVHSVRNILDSPRRQKPGLCTPDIAHARLSHAGPIRPETTHTRERHTGAQMSNVLRQVQIRL